MNRPALLILPLIGLVAACEAEDDDDLHEEQTTVEYINPRSPADGEVAPFSEAVWVGNTLYLSGKTGAGGGPGPRDGRAGGRQRPRQHQVRTGSRGSDHG